MNQLLRGKSFYKFSFLKLSQTLSNVEQTGSTIKKIEILSTYVNSLNPSQKQQTQKLFKFVHQKISTGVSNKLLLAKCSKQFGVIDYDKDTQKNKQTVLFLQKYIPQDKPSDNIPVEEINKILIKLTQISGKNAVQLKMTEVLATLNKLSFIQSRFFLRILTKDMKIGMKSKLVQKAYEESTNNDDISDLAINFKTFNAMLARPLRDIEQFQKFCLKKGGTIMADIKYDGQRTLITYEKGKQVILISRNGKAQNDKFTKIAEQLQNIFENQQNLTSITLDAQILAVDKFTQQPLPFQVLLTRKRKEDSLLGPNQDDSILQLVYAFDVLEYNGQKLYTVPLIERKKLIFQNHLIRKGEFQIFKFPEERDKLMDYFHLQVKKKYQGLILKGPEDHYYTNGTRIHWGKLKKGFRIKKQDKGLIDLDLIVMGADYGRGKKVNYFSSFLMGIRDGIKIVPISRVGSGFADEQLEQLTQTFKTKITQKLHQRYKLPATIRMDVWFKPEQVVEVDCQQLTRSPMYEFGFKQGFGGISLRFPVFKRLRSDKSIEQSTDGGMILQEIQKQQSNMSKRN